MATGEKNNSAVIDTDNDSISKMLVNKIMAGADDQSSRLNFVPTRYQFFP